MRSRYSEALIHMAIWLVLVSFPIIINMENAMMSMWHMVRVWLMLFGLMLTFYSNYLWGVDNLLYRKRYWQFVLFNIIVFLLIHFLSDWTNHVVNRIFFNFPDNGHHHGPSGSMRSMMIYNELIFFVLGVGASLGMRYFMRLRQSEMERKRLETEKLTSEISLLKYQMQPHFFFNTLNNIYSLISKSPVDAQKAVHNLSKMMRYILYENVSQTIALSKEIDFLKNYCSLMNLRMNDQIKVSLDVPEEVEGVVIPPLLLIPLLENAFKHGVIPGKQSFIDCKLSIERQNILFVVRNSMVEDEGEDRSYSGIGLNNLRKRLTLLYGDKYTFETKTENEEQYIAKLEIPLNINEKQLDNE